MLCLCTLLVKIAKSQDLLWGTQHPQRGGQPLSLFCASPIFIFPYSPTSGLPWQLTGREPACQFRRLRFNPWVGKIPCRRKWQPTPVFLTGKSYGQRSLMGYRPRDCKESDKLSNKTTTTFPPHSEIFLAIRLSVKKTHTPQCSLHHYLQ